MSLVVLDYRCPGCGWEDESFESRSAPSPYLPCPSCGGRAERIISGTHAGTNWQGEVVRGKAEPPPGPAAVDTSPLADGMRLHKWREKRAAVWRDRDRAEWRSKVG